MRVGFHAPDTVEELAYLVAEAADTRTPLEVMGRGTKREVGRPVALAIKAFGHGCYTECVRLLRGVRNIAHRFGGSHAQRDVLDLTLIEAALRDGQQAVAAALAAERAATRPHSPLARLFVTRAAELKQAA